MDNNMGAFKTCPFCGGEAKSKSDLSIVAGKAVNQFWFQCDNCGAKTATYNNYTQALASWENRANEK